MDAPAPGDFGVDQRDVDWAEKTEGHVLAILLLASAVPWGFYAWGTVRTFHLVPALLSVFVSVAGVAVTARLALVPAEMLLRLLPRYRRAKHYRNAVGKFRARS